MTSLDSMGMIPRAASTQRSKPLKFRRVTPGLAPMVLETNLPGPRLEDELAEDFKSYLLEEEEHPSNDLTTNTSNLESNTDWLAKAKTHKEKGNSLFRISDKYKEAGKEYHRAIHCLRRAKRTAETDSIRVQCYSNMAACDLGLEDYSSARAHASKAIKLDPSNVKALYRRAMARKFAAFDLDGAEADLVAALNVAPDDAMIKRTLEQLRRDRLKAKQAESSLAKKMFS